MTKNNEYEDTTYYIICLEQASHEDSLLFWKPGSAGYTSDYKEAGKFSEEEAKEMNETGRDIALTTTQLFALGAKQHTLLRLSLLDLKDIKKEMKDPTKQDGTKNSPIKEKSNGD